LDSVSGHGTEYRKDAVFNVTTMDRVSIISLGAETTARIVFNPSLPTEALSNATPSGGSTTSQTAVSDMAQDQIETITIDSGTTPIVQIYEDVVIAAGDNVELDVLRLHLDSGLTDSSDSGHTVTAVGNAAISTSEKKFGAGSAYFDGASGKCLSVPSNNDFVFGTGDFTVELWCYPTNNHNYGSMIDNRGSNAGGNGWVLSSNAAGMFWVWGQNDYVVTSGSTPLTENVWHHIAYTRASGTHYLFLDGVLVGTSSGVAQDYQESNPIYIGAYNNGSATAFYGYIDDVRITKGLARYTENFTVPAEAHPDANSAGTTKTFNKTSDYEIEHASDTTVEVKKTSAGSANVKIRVI